MKKIRKQNGRKRKQKNCKSDLLNPKKTTQEISIE